MAATVTTWFGCARWNAPADLDPDTWSETIEEAIEEADEYLGVTVEGRIEGCIPFFNVASGGITVVEL